ncbi:MAG: iron dicitrate transport regulator FecR, partial [Spirochaetaceae bacterium]|nr:iron dicitrate transport regulator FecR [Spirochaetaceae bacterium]
MKISARIQALSATVMLLAAVPLFAVTGTVISVSGKAEIQNNGAWLPLKEGDIIEAGAVISTGFKSEVVLRIGESVLTVKPLTRLTLEELIELDTGITSAVYLDAGGIKADIKATENQRTGFTVKSPAVTA